MKVHLVRSPELSVETFANVFNVLQQFPGPIQFIPGDSEDQIDNHMTRVWENEEDFSKLKEIPKVQRSMISFDFPHEERYQPWDYFFKKCDEFREVNGIRQRDPVDLYDHIFLLTDIGNDLNWFGAVGPSMRDYFIQTSGWSYYFGEGVDERFPIAYEVVIWLVRHLMFDEREEIIEAVHRQSRGCGNDFCQNKKEIILKMRTADLCSDCMDKLRQRDASPMVISQLFDIMDGIRQNMTFRERGRLIRKPSKIEVRGYLKKIFFTDLGDLELRLNPKERTIFLFYLNHPEGIHLTEIQDHRAEISQLYERFTNQFSQVDIDKSIDALIDPLDNNINVVLSRIRRKLRETVGEDMMEFYSIDGPRGEAKFIPIDREFVTYVDVNR
jgi:hypothetical protein